MNSEEMYALLDDKQKQKAEEIKNDMIGVAFGNLAGAALILRAIGEHKFGARIHKLSDQMINHYLVLQTMVDDDGDPYGG